MKRSLAVLIVGALVSMFGVAQAAEPIHVVIGPHHHHHHHHHHGFPRGHHGRR